MGFITLMCPNCNQSLEMDDSREFGFCQYCGTKVMQDKVVVQHTGSVKIDNKEVVEKFLANARRAKQKEDWEETEKYYNLVEQNDPTNIEAIFYSSYGKAMTSLVDSDIYKRKSAFKVLQNCVSILDDNFDMNDEEADKNIIQQISDDIIKITKSNYVYTKTGQGILATDNKNQTEALFFSLCEEFCNTLDEIVKKYPEKDNRIIFYYELALKQKSTSSCLTSVILAPTVSKGLKEDIQKYHVKWHNIDESHEVPKPPETSSSSGGCYVATAVYGSYDCPQVWTLRRYRDNTLAETWYGRAFIHTYYAISPTLVEWFGDTQWFKNKWKPKLDRMVEKLNNEGVQDTPYKDKNWK